MFQKPQSPHVLYIAGPLPMAPSDLDATHCDVSIHSAPTAVNLEDHICGTLHSAIPHQSECDSSEAEKSGDVRQPLASMHVSGKRR